jgi:hypothetical protein
MADDVVVQRGSRRRRSAADVDQVGGLGQDVAWPDADDRDRHRAPLGAATKGGDVADVAVDAELARIEVDDRDHGAPSISRWPSCLRISIICS